MMSLNKKQLILQGPVYWVKRNLCMTIELFQIHPVIRLKGPASPVPMQTNEQVVSL
jgi:hypothetical protein